jgi:phenylacetate-coenzyme A ligase PaaK-like adenylate-forming protein
MICLPGKTEFGVSNLLELGIRKFGGLATVYGARADPDDAVRFMADLAPHCIVGIPVQVLALAERHGIRRRENKLEAVLLTADYAAESLKRRILRELGCRVLNHYGSTEMGYGGALECELQNGLHIRETDLYFEIIDPQSGRVLPRGAEGEVVFTTLSRRGMPLIRYRTGDFAAFIPGKCGCGQLSTRITSPWRRCGGAMRLRDRFVTMPELDEILFSDRQVMDYSASVMEASENEASLKLLVWTLEEDRHWGSALRNRLSSVLPKGVNIDLSTAEFDDVRPGLQGKRVFIDASDRG